MKASDLFDGPRKPAEPEPALSFQLQDRGCEGERPIADVFNEALDVVGGGRDQLHAERIVTIIVRPARRSSRNKGCRSRWQSSYGIKRART